MFEFKHTLKPPEIRGFGERGQASGSSIPCAVFEKGVNVVAVLFMVDTTVNEHNPGQRWLTFYCPLIVMIFQTFSVFIVAIILYGFLCIGEQRFNSGIAGKQF